MMPNHESIPFDPTAFDGASTIELAQGLATLFANEPELIPEGDEVMLRNGATADDPSLATALRLSATIVYRLTH